MSDPRTTPLSQWDAVPGVRTEPTALSDRDLPAPDAAPAGQRRLQGGVEEILDRLKAAETRRAGAMARLEGMLDQWSEREAVDPVPGGAVQQPAHTPAVVVRREVPPADTASAAAEHAPQVISIVRPPDSAPPLLAFEPEGPSHSQTAMFMRAHGIKRRPDGTVGEVLPWRPEAAAERDKPESIARSVSATPHPQSRSGLGTMSERLDALELSLVVAKSELDRMSRRHLTLQRRSLVSACLVLLCAFLVGVLMVQSERRIADVREQTAAARKMAEDATQHANELAAALKRVTDANELIPR